jgi:hypothetical protein
MNCATFCDQRHHRRRDGDVVEFRFQTTSGGKAAR